jgi:hypothetical protein
MTKIRLREGPPAIVWFQLLDAIDGRHLEGTMACGVSLSSFASVRRFRCAVLDMFSKSHLSGLIPLDLVVYRNKAAFEAQPSRPLGRRTTISEMGSESDPLIVVVRSRDEIVQSLTRRKRWMELRRIVRMQTAKRHKLNSGEYRSRPSWEILKDIFVSSEYLQPGQVLQDHELVELESLRKQIFPIFTTDRCEQVSHILHALCRMLKNKISLLTDHEVEGEFLSINSRFDFILRRQSKVLCVFVADCASIEQALAEAMLGCELVAEYEETEIVHAVVTDSREWIIIQNTSEGIFHDVCLMDPNGRGLKQIIEKLNGILS